MSQNQPRFDRRCFIVVIVSMVMLLSWLTDIVQLVLWVACAETPLLGSLSSFHHEPSFSSEHFQ
jgi:hypothetical protein